MQNSKFTVQIIEAAAGRPEVIQLESHGDERHPAILVEIDPHHGSNMSRFCVAGHELISTDQDVLASGGMTGTPVMFPTPGRVRADREDGTSKSRIVRFEDKEFEIRDRDFAGVPHLVHGIVHDRPWKCFEPQRTDSRASVRTDFEIAASDPLYLEQKYPFKSRLSLEFVLRRNGVTIHYTVQNNDTTNMPFGFGLHPFFNRLSGSDTRLAIPAEHILELDEALLPTGTLFTQRQAIGRDLRHAHPVDQLQLDHVFTGLDPASMPRIEYPHQSISVVTETSVDMSHVIAFTPKDQPFALENVSCSPNAINLYTQAQERGDKAAEKASGLIVLRPGQIHRGMVFFRVLTT